MRADCIASIPLVPFSELHGSDVVSSKHQGTACAHLSSHAQHVSLGTRAHANRLVSNALEESVRDTVHAVIGNEMG